MPGRWISHPPHSLCTYTLLFISNMVHAATHPKDAPKNFDFIVLGGGAGGCTVAGRLAENPNVSVLLVEAGVK